MKRQSLYLNWQISKAFLQCMFFSFLSVSNVNAQEDKLMIVANPKGSPAELKYPELKSLLKGEKLRWEDGTKIVIALMKSDTPTGISTSAKIYGMTPDQVKRFWVCLVFKGKGNAPHFFDSFAELENFVAKTPGAIGVEEAKEQSIVKLVLIDGKKSF